MRCYKSDESLVMLRKRLRESKKVFFTRFGDNDIMMMSGRDTRGRTLTARPLGGNRTIFTYMLQHEMLEAFKITDPNYLKAASVGWEKEPGMAEGFHAPFKYNGALVSMVRRVTAQSKFLLPVLFQYLIIMRPKIFDNFVDDFIRPHPKMFIGSAPQKNVEKIIGKIDKYIAVPSTNSYASISSWWPDVRDNLDGIKVVIPNAGQGSRIIQKRLWATGRDVWSLDMGSIFDAWSPTRTWLKQKGHLIRDRYE